MRKIIALINMTLDGFCDHTAGIANDETHQYFSDQLRNADTIIFGRVTYQLMEGHWPAIAKAPTGVKSEDDFAALIDNIAKIVYSKTLSEVDWHKTTLKNEVFKEDIQKLKRQPGKDILVGSPGLIIEFMQQGLIDEYRLLIHPVVIGSGLPLFRNIRERTVLKLLSTKVFECGVVAHYYEPEKAVRNSENTLPGDDAHDDPEESRDDPDESRDDPDNSSAQYDQFFGPFYFEPYAIEVAKRIDPAQVKIALEIASGTGRVTRHLRKRLSADTKLIASDISEQSMAVAKKKLSQLEIDWRTINADQLPFADNSIDLVVCSFGYMFVGDRPKAFAEAHRVLRPGGQLIFTTWDKLEKNPASFAATTIALSYLGKPLSAIDNPSTSMNDEAQISVLLHDAGFKKIDTEKVECSGVCATAKEAAAGLFEGGQFYKEIRKRNAAWVDEIKRKLENELMEKFGVAPMVAPISALISQGWKS